jgi:malonyl-CoA O-methyltransferase
MSAPPAAAPPPEEFRFDRPAIAAAFDRASGAYDAAALLQREVRAELLGRLDYFRLAPTVVLDRGAGTGAATAERARRFRGARASRWTSRGMRARRSSGRGGASPRLRRRARAAAAQQQRRPLSSLMLQWSDRPDSVFAECARVLKPGGLLLFSTFGPDTLEELRAAWATVDLTPRVSVFPGMPELSAALQHARLAEPVLDAERLVRHYPEVRALLQELKAIGARNAAATRTRGLTGPKRLAHDRELRAAPRRARRSRHLEIIRCGLQRRRRGIR